MSANISQTIQENPIFASLTTAEAEELASLCEVLILPPEYRLFSQGQIADDMYVLFKGECKLLVRPTAIADEIEVIYTKLTSAFGPVSDVNKNQRIDVVLTPQVKKTFFSEEESNSQHDNFRANLIYKPE